MLSRPTACFMVDVLIAIDHIKKYTKDIHSADAFESAPTEKFDAVMRKLEILGEALKYVINDDQISGFCNPKWRRIVDFRNVLAHGYFGIDIIEVFDVVKVHLLIFEQEYLVFLQQVKVTVELAEALEEAVLKIATKKDPLGASYLTDIKNKVLGFGENQQGV